MAAAMPMPMDRPASSDHRKRNGIILVAAGVGLGVGAGVLWSASSSKLDDEHKLCPMSTCATPDDLTQAKSLLDEAHTRRGISIGMGIGAALAIAAGGYLLMTPHHDESGVAIQIDRTTAGASYTVRF